MFKSGLQRTKLIFIRYRRDTLKSVLHITDHRAMEIKRS